MPIGFNEDLGYNDPEGFNGPAPTTPPAPPVDFGVWTTREDGKQQKTAPCPCCAVGGGSKRGRSGASGPQSPGYVPPEPFDTDCRCTPYWIFNPDDPQPPPQDVLYVPSLIRFKTDLTAGGASAYFGIQNTCINTLPFYYWHQTAATVNDFCSGTLDVLCVWDGPGSNTWTGPETVLADITFTHAAYVTGVVGAVGSPDGTGRSFVDRWQLIFQPTIEIVCAICETITEGFAADNGWPSEWVGLIYCRNMSYSGSWKYCWRRISYTSTSNPGPTYDVVCNFGSCANGGGIADCYAGSGADLTVGSHIEWGAPASGHLPSGTPPIGTGNWTDTRLYGPNTMTGDYAPNPVDPDHPIYCGTDDEFPLKCQIAIDCAALFANSGCTPDNPRILL